VIFILFSQVDKISSKTKDRCEMTILYQNFQAVFKRTNVYKGIQEYFVRFSGCEIIFVLFRSNIRNLKQRKEVKN